jgi:hypothetical protein
LTIRLATRSLVDPHDPGRVARGGDLFAAAQTDLQVLPPV